MGIPGRMGARTGHAAWSRERGLYLEGQEQAALNVGTVPLVCVPEEMIHKW